MPPDLIAITDDALSDDAIERGAARMLDEVPPGSTALQLRDRRRTARALLALAERLRALCARHAALLFVNDRVDIARAVGADGVHLGGRSFDIVDARRLFAGQCFVSVAAHDLAELDVAVAGGATAALVSPIYATPGKGPARGAPFLAEARQRAGGVVIYALGGIDEGLVAECVHAGAYGVAAMRSVWAQPNGAAAARAMVDRVRASRG